MNTTQMIDLIHARLASGERVIHPTHKAYEFHAEEISNPAVKAYQEAHFATRNGKTLALRCSSNWFGSLVSESDIPEELTPCG